MGLRFILGRAGTGKTHRCLEEIADILNRQGEQGPPLVLLAPEQATFQLERELLARLHRGGTTRGQVLSFRRLAYRVLNAAGGAANPPISDSGKRMLLRSILWRNRSQLRIFGGSAAKPGFVAHLSRILAEFRAHGVDAGLSADLPGDENDALLAAKLRDLGLILREYEKRIAGRFSDPDRYLQLAADRFAAAREWHGAYIWIDGFATFTPMEYRLLESLLLTARQVSVALLLDGRKSLTNPPGEADLFRDAHETYQYLVNQAQRLGVPVTGVEVLDRDHPPVRYKQSAALAFIEANFFSEPADRRPVRASGQVQLVSAADPAAEVEAVAAAITRLRRQGLRPRDISVVVRHLEPYEDWIRRIFTDYRIPHFIDRRRPVVHHPLVQLLQSVLEVIHSDWDPRPLFRCLKTGLVPVSGDTVDRLEDYILAHGIQGADWYDGRPWSFALTPRYREALAEINAAKSQAFGDLYDLYRRLRGTTAVPAEFGRYLIDFLMKLSVPSRLQEWQQAARNEGDLEAAREHQLVWDGVVTLLDEICDAYGDESLSFGEYRQLVEAGLQELDIGLIPPSLDQVLVAAIDRSRHPNVQATFIMGVNDGVFPAAVPEDPVFSDEERVRLAAAGLELGADSRRLLFRERYLVYIAVTRPSRYLWVSYARTDGFGRELAPSPVINRLKRLFPDLEEQVLPVRPSSPAAVEHPQRLAAGLLAHLRSALDTAANPHMSWLGAYDWLLSGDGYRSYLRRLLSSLTEPKTASPLPQELREALISQQHFSVSRLETFATCPFMHFAAYDLGLEEPLRPDLDATRIGSFLHDALYLITREMLTGTRAQDWADLDEAAQIELVDAAMDRLLPAVSQTPAAHSPRHTYLLQELRRTLVWVLRLLIEHARRGDFRPAAVELSFGDAGDVLPPLQITAGNRTVELRGRIDRIDIAVIDGEMWVRVIDYKSSARSLSLSDVSYGLALQLPLYLAAVTDNAAAWLGRPVRPAGAYYLPLSEPLVHDPGADDVDTGGSQLSRERLAAAKLTGVTVGNSAVIRAMDRTISGWSDLVNVGLATSGVPYKNPLTATEEDIHALGRYAAAVAGRLVEQLLQGEVAPRPYRTPSGEVPCRFCAFRSVCRFEPVFGGHRELPPISNDDLWQQISAYRPAGVDK